MTDEHHRTSQSGNPGRYKDQYRLELHKLLTQNELPNRLHMEIMDVVEESLGMMDERIISSYQDIISEIRTPREFLRTFLEHRHVLNTDEYEVFLRGDDEISSEWRFVRENYKRLIQFILLLLSVGILRMVFIVPFVTTPPWGTQTAEYTVFQLIAKFGPNWLNLVGIILVVLYFLVLAVSSVQLLYGSFEDNVSLYLRYFFYFILLGSIIVCLQFIYINQIYWIISDNNQSMDLYVSGSAWDAFQWRVIIIYVIQMALVLVGIYSRSRTGEIYPHNYQNLEKIQQLTKRVARYNKLLYWVNTALIFVVYVPLYIDSTMEQFTADKDMYFTENVSYLILVDLAITIIIGLQMLLFVALVLNWINSQGYEGLDQFSLGQHMRYHQLYAAYLLSTFISEWYLFNTDGAITTTSIFALLFLGIMWFVQLTWVEHGQIVVEKKVSQYYEVKE